LEIFDKKLTITSLEEKEDKNGARYLKARGWNTERAESGGLVRNMFTSINLYGTHELLEETKIRLLNQTDENGNLVAKPRLKLICYQGDLTLPYAYGKNMALLKVYYFDFEKGKFGTKKIMREDLKRLTEGE
jgi:hypothetical protein